MIRALPALVTRAPFRTQTAVGNHPPIAPGSALNKVAITHPLGSFNPTPTDWFYSFRARAAMPHTGYKLAIKAAGNNLFTSAPFPSGLLQANFTASSIPPRQNPVAARQVGKK